MTVSSLQAHLDGLLVFRRFDINSDEHLDTEEAEKALRYLGDNARKPTRAQKACA